MKMQHTTARLAFACALILPLVLCLIAWKASPTHQHIKAIYSKDTVPDKKRDLDKELRQLENARKNISEKDWDKIQRDIEESIQKMDIDKIRQEATESMQKLNLDKVHKQIEESLNRIDFDKLQQQIDESMDKVSKKDIHEQLQKAKMQVDKTLSDAKWKENYEKAMVFNKEEMEKNMEHLHRNMEKLKVDLQQQKFDFKNQMEKAKGELDKAQVELKGYQEMIYDMEKDGLLNTNEDYSIEYKDGDLYVNDKKLPAETAKRYKKYFKKDKIAIKKEKGDMHIKNFSDKHFD